MAIKVMLVDDDGLIRSSLQIILELNTDFQVVSSCTNGEEACREVLSGMEVDVVLMDIRMPVCDGVLATKRMMEVRPKIKVIILTTFDDDEYIFEALKNGAKGYLLKNVSPDKIMEAIKVVNGGNLLIHPEVAAKLSGMLQKEKESSLDRYGLNEGEQRIVKLISDGFTNKEISEKLYLSEGTVKNKITDILGKLNLRDRTQIAIFYLKGGKV